MVTLTVKKAIDEICKMETKADIIMYCQKLHSKQLFDFSDGTEPSGYLYFAGILTNNINCRKLPTDGSYILMHRTQKIMDEDDDGSGNIPNRYYFGINFEAKTITKYTYAEYNKLSGIFRAHEDYIKSLNI